MISCFKYCKLSILFVSSVLCFGCATISRFDQYAYTQVTSVKVDALAIMDSATSPYANNAGGVAQVVTVLAKIYEYELNRPKDAITVKMIALMKDSNNHLFGGFVRRWKKENTLDATFIGESKNVISQAFDQISQLESGKIKPTQVVNNSNK